MSNRSLAVAQPGFEPQNLAEAERLAQTLAQSSLMPDALRNRPADVLVTLLTGRELGLGPMQSLRGIHVIKGKGVASADLIVALVKRSHVCKYFTLVESDEKHAVYETLREGEPQPTKMAFTIEQAKAAGLTGKETWRAHPAAMLRARCSAALARAVYPDLALGIYDTDEGDEIAKPQQQGSVAQMRQPPRPVAVVSERQKESMRPGETTHLAPQPDDISDAEIVPPAQLPSGQWEMEIRLALEAIERASTEEEVTQTGKDLCEAYPDKAHPVRKAVGTRWNERLAEVRKGASNG